eukprot:jgi/Ulvmu1/9948/UM058_0031.1
MVCAHYEASPMVFDMLFADPAFVCGPKAWSARAQPRRHIPVDITEKDGEFEVVADVPGVQKGAINLAIDHHTLTISVSHPDDTSATDTEGAAQPSAAATTTAEEGQDAEARAHAKSDKPEKAGEEPKVLRRERTQRFAERSLKFPETADLEAAKAECEGGVLRVSIPKKALPQPSRIRIA